jgi:hypothetical protein
MRRQSPGAELSFETGEAFEVAMKRSALPGILLLLSPWVWAQDNSNLSQFFEGKQVVVKMDMPGSQSGVDIRPQRPNSLDARSYGDSLKKYPIALHTGDAVMVTKVKVKDKAIEFQLGGGGFGTFMDNSDTSVHFTPASKSQREKDLEDQISNTDDSDKKARLQRELDYLRRQRERDDQRNRAIAVQAAEVKKEQVNQDRMRGGSRFNLKYDRKVPANLTPQDVMAALAPYVSFPPDMGGAGQADAPSAAPAAATAPVANGSTADPALGLQKGMHEDQVRALLGTPASVTDTDHDGIQVHALTFVQGNSHIRAEFVNGVLIRYTISVN